MRKKASPVEKASLEVRNPAPRKIHINLSEEVHKKLRIKCAMADQSIQAYVANLIADDVQSIFEEERGLKLIRRG